MPKWSLDIEKMYQGEYWTNRYWIEAADMAAAMPIASDIYDVERFVHLSIVNFTKYRVSDGQPLTDVYQIVQTNSLGLKVGEAEHLPLFNVCRVDFTTVGGGRPSRKYLRLPILETEQSNGTFIAGMTTFITANYIVPLLDLPYIDVDEQAFNTGAMSLQVGMRQLRRGTKRKLEPVIP